MERKLKEVKLDSAKTFSELYGLKDQSPLIGVIDFKTAQKSPNNLEMEYGVYALYLKDVSVCSLKYGAYPCDYTSGTLVMFAPGQRARLDSPEAQVRPDVIGLLFHLDLIEGTPLGLTMGKYTFFSYKEAESLHLSDSERDIFRRALQEIAEHLRVPAAWHTRDILASQIQLLLDCVNSFYVRQFGTRHAINLKILQNFRVQLKGFYVEGRSTNGFPSVSYFAEKANLSPGYFGELIKKETGKTPQELIGNHILECARQRLVLSKDFVSTIAYDLGFTHPQHFTRFFKQRTGMTPKEFRQSAIRKDKWVR